MTGLSDDELMGMAGGDVTTIADAQDVTVVTPAHVQEAQQAAEDAERQAAESERKAVLGEVGHGQAVSDREAARFARLRAALTARRAERHAAAERIKALDAVGADALKHGAALKDLRDSTLSDLATIEDLRRQIAKRITDWNGQLSELISRASLLEPEQPRPGNVPAPSSAHVYAGGAGVTNAVFVVRNQVLVPIREDHPDGPVAAIDGAHRTSQQHDPAERLLIAPSGLVVPLARDPGGHLARRVAKGELRELSLPEKEHYFNGEPVSF